MNLAYQHSKNKKNLCLSALLKNIIDSKQTKKKWRNKRKASSFTDVSDFQQLTRRPLMDGHYLLANTFMQLEVCVLFVSAWFEFMRDVWFFTVGHNLNRLRSVSPHHICLWFKCSIVSCSLLVYKMYKSNETDESTYKNFHNHIHSTCYRSMHEKRLQPNNYHSFKVYF